MKEDIEIISKTENVKRGNLFASVRSDNGEITNIENGVITDGNSATLANFSKRQYGGLSVQFQTPDCDMVAILTDINTFINDIKE